MRVPLALLTVAVGFFRRGGSRRRGGRAGDGFTVGIAIWAFFPFAMLAAFSPMMSVTGLLVTLLVLAGINALAVSEFLASTDAQAGLI